MCSLWLILYFTSKCFKRQQTNCLLVTSYNRANTACYSNTGFKISNFTVMKRWFCTKQAQEISPIPPVFSNLSPPKQNPRPGHSFVISGRTKSNPLFQIHQQQYYCVIRIIKRVRQLMHGSTKAKRVFKSYYF